MVQQILLLTPPSFSFCYHTATYAMERAFGKSRGLTRRGRLHWATHGEMACSTRSSPFSCLLTASIHAVCCGGRSKIMELNHSVSGLGMMELELERANGESSSREYDREDIFKEQGKYSYTCGDYVGQCKDGMTEGKGTRRWAHGNT